MKLPALMDEPKFLSGIAITGTNASHVRLMCKTYQSYPYCGRVNEREEDQINVVSLHLTDRRLFFVEIV